MIQEKAGGWISGYIIILLTFIKIELDGVLSKEHFQKKRIQIWLK